MVQAAPSPTANAHEMVSYREVSLPTAQKVDEDRYSLNTDHMEFIDRAEERKTGELFA